MEEKTSDAEQAALAKKIKLSPEVVAILRNFAAKRIAESQSAQAIDD
jgi:hypothetical protein